MISLDSEEFGRSYAENADFWMMVIRGRLDRYRSELTDLAVLNTIRPSSGMTILDAGCGEGYLSRMLARQGAQVIGVDVCAELVESARSLARESGLDIDYHNHSVNNLSIVDRCCDIVVCNHLINDLPDISTPIREFYRVTRAGGRLVILMLHPCFYGSRAEHGSKRGYPKPDEYFRVRVVEQEFKVAGIRSPAPVKMWFRPLEDYVAELCDAGYSITSLREPHPSAEQLANDPWWQENFVRPLFLLVVAQKS